jgi:hypothetical protein
MKLVLVRLVHQSVEAAGAVEQAILRMQMQMDKVRVRHRLNLPLGGTTAQGGDIRMQP